MEVACKYPKPLFKTQNSEVFVEYDNSFDMKTGKLNIDAAHPYQNGKDEKSYIPVTFHKNTGNSDGKIYPENKDGTRLQDLSLMNNPYFSAVHYDFHLDMKLS